MVGTKISKTSKAPPASSPRQHRRQRSQPQHPSLRRTQNRARSALRRGSNETLAAKRRSRLRCGGQTDRNPKTRGTSRPTAMNTYFIRHSAGWDVDEAFRHRLWTERKIAIYFEDLRSYDPDDYASASARRAVRTFRDLAQ